MLDLSKLLNQLKLPDILKKTYSGSSREFFGLKKPLEDCPKINSRLKLLISTTISPIQRAITFVYIVRTTLLSLELPGLLKFCLPLFFFAIELTSIDNSIRESQKTRARSKQPGRSLKPSFVRFQVTPRPLSIITKLKSRETLSISRKKS